MGGCVSGGVGWPSMLRGIKAHLLFDLGCLDLEWKVIYVGSPESPEYDQILDSIMVGPIPPGTNKFLFQVCVM